MLLHAARLVCTNGLELERWDMLVRLRELVGGLIDSLSQMI
jgi:hypothetical protein